MKSQMEDSETRLNMQITELKTQVKAKVDSNMNGGGNMRDYSALLSYQSMRESNTSQP